MAAINRLHSKPFVLVLSFMVVCLALVLNCSKQKLGDLPAEEEQYEEPVPPEMVEISISDRELAIYLAEKGYKLAMQWHDSMHAKVGGIENLAERHRKWEELKEVLAPDLLRASISLYSAAIIIDPTFYSANYWISYPLNSSGDRAGAIAACERYVDSIGKNPSLACAWLARMYFEDGKRERAFKTFKKLLLYGPANTSFYMDTKYYLARCDFTPQEVEEVLSLSDVHQSR